ncbi:unnamed protein product [Rhizoctonia solani]|uniref:C2H2-type domain-containing protein n=1 Tax=Rhizoctonia solani TaxID=456999 RepID=A0A8H3EEP7_9AGAM|nr:unnamed protein product [Rhizoctonia solani]
MIFRVYCALFPDNCSPNSENQLLGEIEHWLHSWIRGISWDIEQDVAYCINNLLWHSTIDSGLNRLVEEKIKETVLATLNYRGSRAPYIFNDGLNEAAAPVDLKRKLLLNLTQLLDTVYLPRDNALKPEYRPLQSKKIKGTNTCHRALSELSFNASQAIRNKTIQAELIETLSRVWQLIREDSDPLVDAFGLGGSGQFFSTNEAGEVTLIVPERLHSRHEVKNFVSDALNSGEIDKSVREVKCSLCKNKNYTKFWHIKPSNIERHILTHFGIKTYRCLVPDCGTIFTTKDQLKKHIERRHPGSAEPMA